MADPLSVSREVAEAWTLVAADLFGIPRPSVPALAQTPRDELALEGGAKLYRFRGNGAPKGTPLLLIPSLINRWYVLDLRPGASLVEALVGAGIDVWCLDWGVPEAEDRYLDWEAVLARLGRAVRRVKRETGAAKLAALGYCMGGTLTTIYAAQHAAEIQALITLAAPIDFQRGGQLRCMVEPQWFDADAIADAGNVAPHQMQAGFVALRPTIDLGKIMSMPDLATDRKAREAYLALDAWASDNIPFPAEAYRRYIRDLYQGNELVAGTHRVRGREVKLGVLGYCMGGTLTSIYVAQHADEIAALVTLAAPIDFARGGQLRCMVEPMWFDADAIADAGNVAPTQMQAGFVALRPTLDLGKLVSMPDLAQDPKGRDAFLALDEWASDNIPFPAAAYRRYIKDLYQENQLANGTHRVAGKPVELSKVKCPTLVITASRDSICPPPAATALLDLVGSTEKDVLEVAGGHVGAVVGSKAAREMYPALIKWLQPRRG